MAQPPIPPEANCSNFPPPELIYLRSDIYYASPEQTASLRNLEDQAVQTVLALHRLPPGGAADVRQYPCGAQMHRERRDER